MKEFAYLYIVFHLAFALGNLVCDRDALRTFLYGSLYPLMTSQNCYISSRAGY